MLSFATPPMPRRDLRLAASVAAERWYMGGDPIQSAFFSALSSTFPLGERFFIDSVKPYRDKAPQPLFKEIGDFITQEALHTREHAAFNTLVSDCGYVVEPLTERARRALAPYYAKGPLRMLGGTMALEHFTAILAYEILTQPRRLAAAPAPVAALWRWHAVEELEHKGVTFDTFMWVARTWSPVLRYLYRVLAMLRATWTLFGAVGGNMAGLLAQDQLPAGRTWWPTFLYLMGPKGVLTSVVPHYLAWFIPGFHPWRQDDRALIAECASEFAPPAAA